jgi:hypothetical protein
VGATTAAGTVAGVWSDFDGPLPGVRKFDGTEMTYWGSFAAPRGSSNICFTTADLMKYGDGKCGAWSMFFEDTLSIHGIASTHSAIRPQDTNAVGFAVYSSLPGQGMNPPLVFAFSDHAVTKYSGSIYDPSYGKKYTSEISWEDASVEYFIYPGSVVVLGLSRIDGQKIGPNTERPKP